MPEDQQCLHQIKLIPKAFWDNPQLKTVALLDCKACGMTVGNASFRKVPDNDKILELHLSPPINIEKGERLEVV